MSIRTGLPATVLACLLAVSAAGDRVDQPAIAFVNVSVVTMEDPELLPNLLFCVSGQERIQVVDLDPTRPCE